MKEVYAQLKVQEETEERDRNLLFTENQNSNKRIFVVRGELQEDLKGVQIGLDSMNKKLMKILSAAFSVLDLSRISESAMKLQASLMKQDELDKKGIFLMGIREEDRAKSATKSQRIQR